MALSFSQAQPFTAAIAKDAGNTQREPDALRIMSMLNALEKQAEDLVERTANRLSPIMLPDAPSAAGPVQPAEPLSPLFGEYRARIERVSDVLRRVRYLIDRVEV